MRNEIIVVFTCVAGILQAACQREAPKREVRTAFLETANTPTLISMFDLHQAGGVPPNWAFSLPLGDVAAGREDFQTLGCPTCHFIAGEPFSPNADAAGKLGPDLTGMGSHHPEIYFVESILNPDAVIINEPGYVGNDGRSNMPAYPDITAEQLTDLVAYLKSLKDPQAQANLPENRFTGRIDLAQPNIPPPQQAAAPPPTDKRKAEIFFVQTYTVHDGQLPALEQWFEKTAAPLFTSFDGLLGVETYVDRTRGLGAVVTVFSFPDMKTLQEFMAQRPIAEALEKFDEFADVADRQIYESRPLYRVGTLSSG